MLVEGGEAEQLVAAIFVLFAAGGDFGGQAIFEIAHHRFEAIGDGDDFFLDGEKWNGEKASPSERLMQSKLVRTGFISVREQLSIQSIGGKGKGKQFCYCSSDESLADRDEAFPLNKALLINYWRTETRLSL